jgi:hypothetical protein
LVLIFFLEVYLLQFYHRVNQVLYRLGRLVFEDNDD